MTFVSDVSDETPPIPSYACPQCGQLMSVSPERLNLLICPACRYESFVPEVEAPATDEMADRSAADELSAARIRRLATERRSINRTASYFIVAAGVCVVAIGQFIWMTIQHVRALGWTPRPIGYLLFLVLASWGAWHFGQRAASLHREGRQSGLNEPTSSPDFSALDDGSKQWKNFEEIR